MLRPLREHSGFSKQVAEMPRNPLSDKTILAIQINLRVEDVPKPDINLAQELLECLSVIKPAVLAELKKLLSNT